MKFMDKSNISESNQGDLAIEQALGWAAGTLGCLREAFAAGRRRDEPWEIARVPEERQPAMAQAAAVFRRGVGVAGVESAAYRPAEILSTRSVAEALALVPGSHGLSEGQGGAIPGRFLFVVDEAITRLWPEFRESHLRFPACILRGGESVKNLETASRLTAWIRSHSGSADHGLQVVAIGGGVTLDVAGFAAGLCGLEHVNIPTTLLAMVDAAIGGKTGVNFPPFGKNQVGLFHFPARVIICPDFLRTLPVEEIRAGAAECLKHALLASDLDFFEKWVRLARDGNAAFAEDGGPVVVVTRMKEAFVERDPFELSGARELLNLGHTTAHALESVAQSRGLVIRHGAAVAMGLACKVQLMAAAQPECLGLARKIMSGLRSSRCVDEVIAWLSGPDIAIDALWAAMVDQMRQDKKLRSGDRTGIRVVGLRWNQATGILEAHATEVELEALRRAFVSCLQELR